MFDLNVVKPITFRLLSKVVSRFTRKLSSILTSVPYPTAPASVSFSFLTPRIKSPVIPRMVLSASSVPPATPSVPIPIPAAQTPDHS